MDQRPADDDGAGPEWPRRHPHLFGAFQRSTDTVSMSMDFPTDSSTSSLVPPLVSDMGAAMGLFDGARPAAPHDRASLRASNPKSKGDSGDGGAHANAGGASLRSRLWKRVASMRPKRRRPSERASIDQELYVRSILESYSSSMSSNRYSSSIFVEAAAVRSPSPGASADSDSELTVVCADGSAPTGDAAYLAQLQTPSMAGKADVTAVTGKGSAHSHRKASNKRSRARSGAERSDGDSEDGGDEEKNQRRLQRRLKIEAMRAKLLEKNQHHARTRKKIFIFSMWILVTLTAFMAAGVLIARTGVQIQTKSVEEEHSEAAAASSSSTSASRAYDSSSEEVSVTTLYTYMHCVLMSLSLWMSLVVVGMHITFRSFRTYSHPFVLELSCVQCGYWIISLLRVQFETHAMSDAVYLLFCMAECFFNFGQISFTCAIAFNMYRSVVSYADVLLDSQSAKQRYRSYTLNVMLLSLLAAVTLALVGYKTGDDSSSDESLADLDNMQPCLYPTCRLILYVYYPLLAFGFNFIFYIRFKRTIGTAYPVSATGRLNKVALSYLVVFFICWGSLIISTALTVASSSGVPEVVFFVLQCVFDVLGMCTAVITFTNFHRCRKAFDFGLSLKAIDPNSIEFDDPVNIVGEGTFAIVLKARWRQGAVDNSFARSVEVAVKTFKHTQLECLDQIKEEAYLSSRLVHPCVMMTYGCYTSGINLYIVYEYLGGGTLQDVLDASSSLPYATALRYARMIAMGMRFLHGLPVPIVHRDLKPLNCIFDSNREMLKVADFGESRLLRTKDVVPRRANFFPSADLTLQMTTNIGSACWAAPEVLKDELTSEYSVKIDVYSFGIICWQLYTCRVPYVEIPGSVLAVAEAVLAGHRPEIPSDCPKLFAKIMKRCWHESALRRPSFDDIVQLLEIEMANEKQRLRGGEDGGSISLSASRKVHAMPKPMAGGFDPKRLDSDDSSKSYGGSGRSKSAGK